MGEMRSTIRAVMLAGSPGTSRRIFSSGNSGVRSSNLGRSRASSGVLPLTVSMRSRAGYFSLLAAGRLAPSIASPLRRAERRVHVVGTGEEALGPQEAVALVPEVEEARHRDRFSGVLLLVAALALQV